MKEIFSGISVKGLGKQYGHFVVLDDVTFELPAGNYLTLFGINSPEDFEKGRQIIQKQIFESIQKAGVIISDTSNVTIDINVKIGSGTVINKSSAITGITSIGKKCIIGPNVTIQNSTIGNQCKIENQKILNSSIGDNTIITL